MATWTEVKQYLYQNFKVENDKGDSMTLIVSNENRTQLVSVINANDLLIFSSPIAEVGKVQPGQVLKFTEYFGVAQFKSFYLLRNVSFLGSLDIEDLLVSVEGLAIAADEIESALSNGQDNV